MEELENKLPDIATSAHCVRLDAKATYFAPNAFRADAAQTRANISDAIVWCKPNRNGYDTSEMYDSHVHQQAEIWGWTLVADMKNGTQVDEDLEVDRSCVRPLTTLLEWVKHGTLP